MAPESRKYPRGYRSWYEIDTRGLLPQMTDQQYDLLSQSVSNYMVTPTGCCLMPEFFSRQHVETYQKIQEITDLTPKEVAVILSRSALTAKRCTLNGVVQEGLALVIMQEGIQRRSEDPSIPDSKFYPQAALEILATKASLEKQKHLVTRKKSR